MLVKIIIFINWLRWGVITEKIVARGDWGAEEIEYRDRRGNIVGYWAYGSFDPAFPYRGQPARLK